MNESLEVQQYREHLKKFQRAMAADEKKRAEVFVAKMRRRIRGAKFGVHDPLFSDEATNANQ